jgi:hypothetical protein
MENKEDTSRDIEGSFGDSKMVNMALEKVKSGKNFDRYKILGIPDDTIVTIEDDTTVRCITKSGEKIITKPDWYIDGNKKDEYPTPSICPRGGGMVVHNNTAPNNDQTVTTAGLGICMGGDMCGPNENSRCWSGDNPTCTRIR